MNSQPVQFTAFNTKLNLATLALKGHFAHAFGFTTTRALKNVVKYIWAHGRILKSI